MSTIEVAPIGVNNFDVASWSTYDHGQTIRCRVLICPEVSGGYSAFAADLPGAASQGDTLEDAKRNIADALAEVIRYHREMGEEIPWEDAEIKRAGDTVEQWIIVNA